MDRNAGRAAPYPPEGQDVPERAKSTVGTKHQSTQKGKSPFREIKDDGVAFCISVPVP